MSKAKRTQNRRQRRKHVTARGALLFLAACLVLAAVWYVGNGTRKVTPAPEKTKRQVDTPSPAPSNPYAGWKTYAIPSSNLHFAYPKDWKLMPNTGPKGPLGLTPGTPETELTAPDGLYMDILTDNDSSRPEPGNTILLAQPIQSLGTDYYLDYIDAVGDHNVTYAAVLTGTSANAPYPAVKMPDGTNSRLIVSVAYRVNTGPDEKPLSTYRKDPAIQTAKLVLASLRN